MKVAWKLIKAGSGYAQVAPWPNTLTRQDGTPSVQGDVISIQPDGTIQTRDVTKVGAWEICALNGACLIYQVDSNTFVLIPE